MSLITIDETRCKQDGICAMECPFGIIAWQPESFPAVVNGAERLCINCGHCVAVCPHEALTHKHLAPDQCLPVDPALALSPEQARQFLRSRRAIRNFRKKAVEKDLLEQLIKLASYAPSGHNMQPVKWQVINGREKVHEYTAIMVEWIKQLVETKPEMAKGFGMDIVAKAWDKGRNAITRDAPHLVLVNGPAKNPTAPAACTIAMTYFDLAAQAFGLATCWCGFFHMGVVSYPPLKAALGLGDEVQNLGAMMVGYPKFTYPRMPERNTPDITWTE